MDMKPSRDNWPVVAFYSLMGAWMFLVLLRGLGVIRW
jgi:hypothetical protein